MVETMWKQYAELNYGKLDKQVYLEKREEDKFGEQVNAFKKKFKRNSKKKIVHLNMEVVHIHGFLGKSLD